MPTVPTGDIATYYEDTGTGEPLVLICGLSTDLQVWRFQVPEFAKCMRVICYDLCGAGRSSAPDAPYSIDSMAGHLAALLDHLQIASAHILGWSMGGAIAQSFALTYPTRVRKLILLSTFAEIDGLVRLAIRNWMNVRRSDMPFEQVCRFVSRWLYSPDLYDNDALYERFVKVMVTNPYPQTLHGFLRQAEALLAYVPPRDPASIHAPTLVVLGKHDNLIPPYLSERLAQRIPTSQLLVLSGAHSGFIEFPDEYNRAFLAFLSAGQSL